MLELDGTRAAYDAFGNLIERIGADGSKMELGYDGADRLVALWRREPNGHVTEARYAYDALGRRIRKEVVEHDGESRIRFGWEGDRQVAEDIDGELTRTTLYEPESFVPLARIEMRPGGPGEESDEEQLEAQAMLSQVKHTLLAGGLALPEELIEAQAQLPQPAIRIGWFHTDHLGTPLALTDDNGVLLWYARPDDWGAVREAHGSVIQPIRFQGQYHDGESGLYYNRHRYYDPQMGRYASQDPIGLLGGLNTYGYASSPVNVVDPFGLAGEAVSGKQGMEDKIGAIREAGTGVRIGGAKASIGSVEVKGVYGERSHGAPIGSATSGKAQVKPAKKTLGAEVGTTCTEKEVALSPWSWKFWQKKLGLESGNTKGSVSINGPGVSVDPVCIDPGQVLNRTAAEATDIVINNNGLMKPAANPGATLKAREAAAGL